MFVQNLKYLRKKEKLSQNALAVQLGIPRTTLSGYELGKAEPSIKMLIKMTNFFKVKLDAFLNGIIAHADMEVARQDDLRILAISVDKEDRENIEFVDSKAEAGYLESFQDPEYIGDLPKISLPMTPHGTLRAFGIEGDSMLPMESGSIVVCSFMENIKDVKDGKTYVIATKEHGIKYKRIMVNKGGNSMTLVSDNPVFAPYAIHFRDIAEIWEYYAHISFNDEKRNGTGLDNQILVETHKMVGEIKTMIK